MADRPDPSVGSHRRSRTPLWVYGVVVSMSLAVGVVFSVITGNPLW